MNVDQIASIRHAADQLSRGDCSSSQQRRIAKELRQHLEAALPPNGDDSTSSSVESPSDQSSVYDAVPASAGQLDVVLVDDVPEMVSVLQRLITLLGHQCRTANSVEAAWRLIGARVPDVIITDLQMPDVNGQAFAKSILRDAATKGVPVIALTSELDLLRNVDEGDFAGRLLKPVSLKMLRAIFVSVRRDR